ncbi:MAG: hypothetical protein RL194_1496, partial [Pseudomonadota bacterium]
ARNGYAGNLSTSPNLVDIGSVATSAGLRQFSSGSGPEAVFVRATQQVPASLIAGGIFAGQVTLTAEAVALADPSLVSFGAGSFAVELNSEDSTLLNGLLGQMLGSSLNLGVLTYRNIAGTHVNLQDMLEVSQQAGTYRELLDSQILLGDLLQLYADAASQSGAADIQAVAAMEAIAGASIRNVSIRLRDVVAVTTPDENAAATTALNALGLITTSAMIAHGANAMTLPLGVNVSGITSINAIVIVEEPPQMVIGPASGEDGTVCTTMRTAQVRARVPVLVSIPLLARIDLSLNVEVAQGRADLRSINVGDDLTEVGIEAYPGLAAITLTRTGSTDPARISTLSLPLVPSIPIADISMNLPLQPSGSQVLEFEVEHPVSTHLPQVMSVASPLGNSLQNTLSQPGAISVTVLSIVNLGLVNTVVSTVISPLLGEIGRVLLDPLFRLLGIRLGGMDVMLNGLHYRQARALVI